MQNNPWRSMWIKPRETIRDVAEETPNKALWLLAWIYGFGSLLGSFQSLNVAPAVGMGLALLIAIVLAPFWGMLIFAVWSWIILWVGKLLKGAGTFKTIRAAYAWSCVPLIVNVPLWLILVAFYSQLLFFGTEDQAMLSGPALTVLFLILTGKLVFAIWALVIYLQALAEVQQFSVLRSIGNVILGAIVVSLIMALLWVLLVHSMHMTSEVPVPSSGTPTAWAKLHWIVQLIK